jgi:ankyrin repeat protein
MSFLKSLSASQALEVVKAIILGNDDNTIVILNKMFVELVDIGCHLEIIKMLLLDPRVDPAFNSNQAIVSASENNHAETVAILLSDPRINPDDRRNSAIGYASERGHIAVVELLLKDPRVNAGGDRNYALRNTFGNNHVEIAKLLLQDPKVDPNSITEYAITTALKKGYMEIVKLLLPKIDLSKITDTKILDIAREMNLIPKVIKVLSFPELKEFMMEQMRHHNMCKLSMENEEMMYSCKF